MNALASYARHLIVTGLMLAVAKFKLPATGAAEAADWVALAIVGSLTWLLVKYAPKWAKDLGLLLVVATLCVGGMTGCAEYPVAASVRFDQGTVSYSAKGVVVEWDARK